MGELIGIIIFLFKILLVIVPFYILFSFIFGYPIVFTDMIYHSAAIGIGLIIVAFVGWVIFLIVQGFMKKRK